MFSALLAVLAGRALATGPEVTLKARSHQPGEVILVVVQDQEPGRAPAGRFREAALDFFPGARPGTYLALAALDLEVSTGIVRLELDLAGRDGIRHLWGSDVVIEPKEFPTKELKVAKRYVTPPKEDDDRAEREFVLMRELLSRRGAERLFMGSFHIPIPGAPSARFGERRVFNKVPKSPHSGADLRAKTGTPVKAAGRGKVVLARGIFYAGNTVVLDHGLGLFTYYSHLSKISVREGQILPRGALLGKVGATGRVTGPHLHWAARLQGAKIDPFSLLALDLDRWF